MQLDRSDNKKVNVKLALTTATSVLLGLSSPSQASVANQLKDWSFDTALLYYGEVDRVTATEGMIAAKKTFDDDSLLNLQFTFDSLTGASPNGTVPQPNTQTVTSPSGNVSTKNDTSSMYSDFHDTRVQLNAQWTQPFASDCTFNGGVHFSKESDYLSLGINGSLAYDFNHKNSTISIGSSFYHDVISPVGGIPKPLSKLSNTSENEQDDTSELGQDDTKTTTDFMVGFTQVISRRLITQFNYAYTAVDGYLNDPYKRLSRVNANGDTIDYVYESRPNKRTKQSIYAQAKYMFGGRLLNNRVLDVSYRHMWDDWDISSDTVDTRLYIPLSKGRYLEPHIRLYKQSAANFSKPFLYIDDQLPNYASSDLRIGELKTYTVGIKYGMLLKRDNELSFRLEYYNQKPLNAGFEQPGYLATQDLYKPVNAIIAQVTYSF